MNQIDYYETVKGSKLSIIENGDTYSVLLGIEVIGENLKRYEAYELFGSVVLINEKIKRSLNN